MMMAEPPFTHSVEAPTPAAVGEMENPLNEGAHRHCRRRGSVIINDCVPAYSKALAASTPISCLLARPAACTHCTTACAAASPITHTTGQSAA
jgi:hypothetical protein